ncbi:MAG: hypothetical protein EOM03_06480 [Clostridia bacterium]|nr:hypothetical protein [Clostridia bacterium]
MNTKLKQIYSKIFSPKERPDLEEKPPCPEPEPVAEIHDVENIQPFFFIHIPKTAGTSFRMAALHCFGEAALCQDYGPTSPETSPLALAKAYEDQDLFGLQQALEESSCRFFGGHVALTRYASLFQAMRFVSFVREPVAQLCSHFAHYVRLHGYTDTLEAFLANPHRGAGLQSRMLSGLPLEAMGFVGVTERYEDSLRVFNACYDCDFLPEKHNLNPEKNGSAYEISKELLAKFDQLMAQDLALYSRANTLLDARLHALATGQPFVHGALSSVTKTGVSGFAFFQDDTRPVHVEILVNDTPVHTTKAVTNRPGLRAFNVPRNGFVGFDFKASPLLVPGDRITAQVLDTGQQLDSALVPEK